MEMLRRHIRPLASRVRDYLGARLEQMLAELRGQGAAIERQIVDLSGRLEMLLPPDDTRRTSPPTPATLDINLLLHQSRAALLRQMPPGARTLLSAGCAGRWYFDWIEQCYGRVPEHIGIELYAPTPDDLPTNVRWIANSVSDMSEVVDASCDLVFSGQNIEHLWPEEVAGFMAEAARVARPGGVLVIDSPNRLLTAALNWSHPEHTVEVTASEAVELYTLAGFDVTKTVGLWTCRDPRTGRLLPFDPNAPDGEWSVTERLVAAPAMPDHAFLWWMEGRRNDRSPDAAGLQATMAAIFADAWPERIGRLVAGPGLQRVGVGGEAWIDVPAGWTDAAMFGPYMPLRAGRYNVSFDLEPSPDAADGYAACDVVWGEACVELARIQVPARARRISLDFSLPELRFGIQFRCFAQAGAGFRLRRGVTLIEHRS